MIKNIIRNVIIWILTQEARLVLLKYRPKIVAITGNAGKTGTKDAVAAILSSEISVWKNEKSYNSDIGIPLTILHCKNAWSHVHLWIKNIIEGLILILLPYNYPRWLVLEVGADKPGDISKFTHWLKPDIVIVTRIGTTPVHVENFKDRNELLKEKGQLVRALHHHGVLILNADDPDVLNMRDLSIGSRVVTIGFSPNVNFQASNYKVTYHEKDDVLLPNGLTFKVDYLGNSIPVRIKGVVGLNYIYSALSAFAVGMSLNINFVSMLQSISEYDYPLGRMNLIDGMNNSIIVDDSYNSSPAAVELALESIKDLKVAGRKIAVLGDMLELGVHTVDSHLNVGKLVPKYFEQLVTVGQRAEKIMEGAISVGFDPKRIESFNDGAAAGEYLAKNIKSNDLIFVKGSQGIRLEKVIERIMLHPENREKLLPRQEKEWITKPATA